MLARFEVGGTPRTNPTGYVLRSPTHWIHEIARSGVPLQIWWSMTDQIVIDQTHQSAHFYSELRKLRPRAKVEAVTGAWRHSAEMRHDTQLPDAVRWLGLLPVCRRHTCRTRLTEWCGSSSPIVTTFPRTAASRSSPTR